MNKRFLYLTVIFGLMITACHDLQNPLSTQQKSEKQLTAPGSSTIIGNNVSNIVLINDYEVKFNGKTYDEQKNQSTFSYTVSGTGIEPALNYFFLETPSCAGTPTAYMPTNSAKVLEDGIQWESSIPTTGSGTYSITYEGDLPVGAVDARIEGGNQSTTKEVPGPCKGIFTISGTVFVDANSNQVKENSESGIRNTTVLLKSVDGLEYLQKTSADGTFSFTVLTGSSSVDFEIDVPDTTNDTSDFNEQLFNSYTATLSTKTTVTVNGANVENIDFGFAPQTQKMIQQFEDGSIQLKTEEPKFWIKQLRFAKNNNSNAEVSADELRDYLDQIEGLLLQQPFQFGDNKIETALDILSHPIKTDLDALLVQLLTAELNVVSGRGSNSLDFDLTLLSYGESSANESGYTVMQKSVTTNTATTYSTGDAITLLKSFNYSGGGGGVGN